jgi:TRAP-type C4-dicarboxylate transport system substrate-binding protein|tara:strand:+ start:283 stop:552 length:270 start_codon:yes stop_codon:yes gene_type:complete
MTRGFNKLTKKEQQELEKLIREVTEEAKSVVEDYKENPSEMSGSSVHIHENSPFMEEMYKGDSWKHVIHGDVTDGIKAAIKAKKDKKNT